MSHHTILLIEEDPGAIRLFNHVLSREYELVPVFSAQAASPELEKKSVALVMLSQRMCAVQSLELVALIKAEWPALPVVLITENPDGEAILAAVRAGCVDVLTKPLHEMEIRTCLNRVLSTTAPSRSQGLQQILPRLKSFFAAHSQGRVSTSLLLRPATPLQERCESELCTGTSLRMQIRFFGKFRVTINGREIANWTSRKSKLLFAYLAINHKRRLSREVLMEAFWPCAEPNSARNSLNVALHHVRRALHELFPNCDFIVFKDECYFLNPDLELWLDVEEFKQHWKRAQCRERDNGREAAVPEYERAIDMYEGDFMEEDVYEGWAASQREHFKEIYLTALDRISKVHSLNGKPELAINLCEHILARDNCREDVHRRLMLCYYRIGKRDKALKQFKQCEKILQAELEVKPTRATLELYERIKNGGGKKRGFFSKN